MADQVWQEKGGHQPLWNEVKNTRQVRPSENQSSEGIGMYDRL